MNPTATLIYGFALSALLLFPVWPALAGEAPPKTVQFNRDMRPILVDNCYRCHGPDPKQRQADLRLDVRDVALSAKAIVPGRPEQSGLVERIFNQSPDEVMPPPASQKKLTSQQKDLLRRWIADGALYQGHWSYTPPVKPDVPAGAGGVDYLVQRRLAGHGSQAVARSGSPHADPPAVPGPDRPAAASREKSMRSQPIRPRKPTGGWSRSCWRRRILASGWPSAGWMSCDSPTRSATTRTIPATCGRTATT